MPSDQIEIPAKTANRRTAIALLRPKTDFEKSAMVICFFEKLNSNSEQRWEVSSRELRMLGSSGVAQDWWADSREQGLNRAIFGQRMELHPRAARNVELES